MKMVNVADILNKKLYSAKYDNQNDVFIENDFKDNIIYNNFPINKPLYWKVIRNAPNHFVSWFQGACNYNSMQTTLITEEGFHFEHNFSNFIGCSICCLEDEALALYLTMIDYSNYKNNLETSFSRDLQVLFPNIDFKEGIPDFIFENNELFNETLRNKIHNVKSNYEKYSEQYQQAKKHPNLCFISDINHTNINYDSTYFIFDLWNEDHTNKEQFSFLIEKINKTKKDIFYIAIIAKNANKDNFSKAITDFNNR